MARENLLPIWGLLNEDERFLLREAMFEMFDADDDTVDTKLMFSDRQIACECVDKFQRRTIELINSRADDSELIIRYKDQLQHYTTLLEKLRGTAADVQAGLTHSQPADGP